MGNGYGREEEGVICRLGVVLGCSTHWQFQKNIIDNDVTKKSDSIICRIYNRCFF